MTFARIVQQFSHWLPSHLVAVLLLAFKHQISLTPSKEIFKCGALYSALINCSSFFIITGMEYFWSVVQETPWLTFPLFRSYSIASVRKSIILGWLTSKSRSRWVHIARFNHNAWICVGTIDDTYRRIVGVHIIEWKRCLQNFDTVKSSETIRRKGSLIENWISARSNFLCQRFREYFCQLYKNFRFLSALYSFP